MVLPSWRKQDAAFQPLHCIRIETDPSCLKCLFQLLSISRSREQDVCRSFELNRLDASLPVLVSSYFLVLALVRRELQLGYAKFFSMGYNFIISPTSISAHFQMFCIYMQLLFLAFSKQLLRILPESYSSTVRSSPGSGLWNR